MLEPLFGFSHILICGDLFPLYHFTGIAPPGPRKGRLGRPGLCIVNVSLREPPLPIHKIFFFKDLLIYP